MKELVNNNYLKMTTFDSSKPIITKMTLCSHQTPPHFLAHFQFYLQTAFTTDTATLADTFFFKLSLHNSLLTH